MKCFIKVLLLLFLFQFCGIEFSHGYWDGYLTVAPEGPQACEDYYTGTVYVSQDVQHYQTSWVGYYEYPFYFTHLPDAGWAYGEISTVFFTDPIQYCAGYNDVYWGEQPQGEVMIPITLIITGG